MKKQLYIIPISAVATFSLLPLNQKIAPLFQVSLSENPAVNGMAAAQILTLGVVAVVLMLTRFLNPFGFKKFWRLGDFSAPAAKVSWLGIKAGESWRSVGASFSIVITLATAAFMWFGYYQKTPVAWLDALPFVVIFAINNSFSEEMLTRFSLAAGLSEAVSNRAICWWSAAIFGGVHFFGTPGGVLGVFMAGFMGWLLAKSVLETRGFGWAWFIHFLQDVVIMFALLGTK